MVFNSFEFAIFIPIIFFFYWFVFKNNLRAQNLFIVASSFLFYGWWDWRFLFLLILSAGIDFVVALRINDARLKNAKKRWLVVSIVTNLSILGFFKYYNFFIDSFMNVVTVFGSHVDITTLKIILPVGISFYTFQALSYTIDVYRGNLKPSKDPVVYFAFISFFPQLVAGPIERATNLLPQFERKRKFDYPLAVDGLRQILWGLFKKIVIADNCARYADIIFNNYYEYSGSTLLLGGILFAFQIYGDFSGYSDIAIGLSRLLGFELMKNFSFPYFSRDIAEFWRRWHISLSTWFRDYVYFPLGGSKGTTALTIRNTLIIFLLSGFWHGANWTFVVWGFLNAIYFIPLLLAGKNRMNLNIVAHNKTIPSIKEFFQIVITFFIVTTGWIFFRSDTISQAWFIVMKIFSVSLFTIPHFPMITKTLPLFVVLVVFIVLEWMGRKGNYGLSFVERIPRKHYRLPIYYVIVGVILYFGSYESNQFIYFQF